MTHLFFRSTTSNFFMLSQSSCLYYFYHIYFFVQLISFLVGYSDIYFLCLCKIIILFFLIFNIFFLNFLVIYNFFLWCLVNFIIFAHNFSFVAFPLITAFLYKNNSRKGYLFCRDTPSMNLLTHYILINFF